MTHVAPGAEVAPGLVLRERLASGVLGETWRAERGPEPVAVKVTADAQGALLLERECRLGELLAHPRVVPWGGFVQAGGLAVAHAPFLAGGDARRLAERPLAEALGALAEVADALAHLHARGLVHRDLKPSNVLLDAAGRPHLVDLSAAGPAHPADDAWALGLLLRAVLPARPPRVETLAQELLDPEPAARPTAEAARDVLRRAAQEAGRERLAPPRSAAPRVSPVPLPGPQSRPTVSPRGPKLAALAALLAVALGLGAWAAARLRKGAVATPTSPMRTTEPVAERPTVAANAPRELAVAVGRSEAPAPVATRPRTAPHESGAAPAGDAFAVAMGAALAAADRRAWGEAEAALERAAAARPGAPELADLAARVAEGRRGDEIARLREAAAAAAAAEDWRAAATACEEALKLDPALAFAQQGLARARERGQVAEAIERHLARPDRLAVEAVAREAELVLERARESTPGPRLAARAAALEAALAQARTPVAVRLVSDGLTQVTVLRLGVQGAFAEKTVALRPGTWTVVGTRAGYRDVRRSVVVAPGREAAPVLVRCEEPL